MRIMGFTNPVRAFRAFLEAEGIPFDRESFDRLADLRGDSADEELRNGFIIRGYDDLQRLCDLADTVVATDPVYGMVVAFAPEDWAAR